MAAVGLKPLELDVEAQGFHLGDATFGGLWVDQRITSAWNTKNLGGDVLCIFLTVEIVNGGGVAQTRIDQTIRTAVSHPALYQTFNPFTTTPVQGVNWNYGPNFGTALNRFWSSSANWFVRPLPS